MYVKLVEDKKGNPRDRRHRILAVESHRQPGLKGVQKRQYHLMVITGRDLEAIVSGTERVLEITLAKLREKIRKVQPYCDAVELKRLVKSVRDILSNLAWEYQQNYEAALKAQGWHRGERVRVEYVEIPMPTGPDLTKEQRETLKMMQRLAAKVVHPDSGNGSHEKMTRINVLVDELLRGA